jgi:hypothetical protein
MHSFRRRFVSTGTNLLARGLAKITATGSRAKAAIQPHQMPPLFNSQQCNEARHLFRAILRESTYLPDPQARIHIATHATARFREYSPGHKPDDILIQRRRLQLDDARKSLSELRRANQGDMRYCVTFSTSRQPMPTSSPIRCPSYHLNILPSLTPRNWPLRPPLSVLCSDHGP